MVDTLPTYPDPDFAELERVLKGEQEPRRVHLAELLIDEEVLQAIAQRYLGQQWVPSTAETRELYGRQVVALYHRLGYDFATTSYPGAAGEMPGSITRPPNTD